MITTLRSILKGHVYKVFLWIFLIVLIVGGLSFDFHDSRPWVIKVYKQKSQELDYRQAVQNLQRQYDNLKAQGITWPRSETVEKEVLRHMVVQMLMQSVAEQLNFVVPSLLVQEQLQGQLASLPDYFFDTNGQLNVAMLEKLIAPQTFEKLIEDIEREVASSLLYNLISIGSYVPQFEIAIQYNEEYADKKYSIVKFTLEKALQKVKENKVTDEVLERFYKKTEHADTYKSVEKRAGHYWKFDAKDYGLTISKADIAAYYDKHKQAEFLETPAQMQVHRIFFEQHDNYDAKAQAHIVHDELMQDPTTFAAVAKKIAASKLSYQGSAKTEFFAKDSTKYDQILVDTAFEQLSEDLAISNVIKTEKGYEILQRVARKSAKYKSQQDVAHEIEQKLMEEKFAKRFKQDAERLVSNAAYNKQALQNFIEKKNGRKEILDLQERKGGLFSIQLFQTDAGHYAIFMEGKHGILLECTQVQKRALKPFDTIKAQVREDYYKKQAEQELQAMATNAMKQLANGDNLEEFAKAHEAYFDTAQAVYKTGQLDQSAILRRPEIAQKIKALQSVGAMMDIITPTESFVIRLDELAQVDENLFKEKKSVIETTLTNKAKYKGRDSFIACLYRDAILNGMIEVKDQLLKDAKDTEL